MILSPLVPPPPGLDTMPSSLADLQTEQKNSKTWDIDIVSTTRLCGASSTEEMIEITRAQWGIPNMPQR